jgi:hypothetical protein
MPFVMPSPHLESASKTVLSSGIFVYPLEGRWCVAQELTVQSAGLPLHLSAPAGGLGTEAP